MYTVSESERESQRVKVRVEFENAVFELLLCILWWHRMNSFVYFILSSMRERWYIVWMLASALFHTREHEKRIIFSLLQSNNNNNDATMTKIEMSFRSWKVENENLIFYSFSYRNIIAVIVVIILTITDIILLIPPTSSSSPISIY